MLRRMRTQGEEGDEEAEEEESVGVSMLNKEVVVVEEVEEVEEVEVVIITSVRVVDWLGKNASHTSRNQVQSWALCLSAFPFHTRNHHVHMHASVRT